MSWSVQAVGKRDAVAKKIADQAAAQKCRRAVSAIKAAATEGGELERLKTELEIANKRMMDAEEKYSSLCNGVLSMIRLEAKEK